ncbi:MAG: IclR family transcriptional regulator [Blastocatellia bacterium]|nr:IclR family transcriptional regulator [Blastocatellia bacterium]
MKNPTISPQTPGVRVLHKTLTILEILRSDRSGLSLSELTSRVGLPKATVYRIVATLESRGYLDRTSDGNYRLGRKFFERQPEGNSQQVLIQAARPAMKLLLDSCKETLNLGILDGGEVVVIETLESPLTVRMSSKIGNRRSPHSTALGKILLAALPEKDAHRIVRARGLPRFTDHTITTWTSLTSELEKVRQQGYAFDNCENEPDGRCVAAPIFGPGRSVIAALSLSGPLPRMTMSRARSFVKILSEACQTISEAIGGDS